MRETPRKCVAFLLRREPKAKSFRSRWSTAKAEASKEAAARSSGTKVAEYYVPTYAVVFPQLLGHELTARREPCQQPS